MATRTPYKNAEDSTHGEEEKKPLFPVDESGKGGVYDDQKTPLGDASDPRGDLNARQQSPSGDSSDPRGDGSDKLSTPGDLKDAESSGDTGPGGAIGSKEKGLMDKSKSLYNPTDSVLPPPARFAKALSRVMTKKNARNGGIVGGVIGVLIAGLFFLGSYELTAVRENMLGRVNKLPNSAMSNRRVNSFARGIKDGTFDKRLNKEKFVKKMTDKGFIIGYSTDGKKKINTLQFDYKDANGKIIETKNFDFDEPNISKATSDFFSSDAAGRRAYREFQATTGWPASTWKGRQQTKLNAKFKISFTNWLDEPNTDKPKTLRQRFNEKFRKAQADTNYKNGGSAENPSDANGDGVDDTDKTKPAAKEVGAPPTEEAATADAEELLINPASGAPDLPRQGLINSLSDSRSQGLSFREAMSAARGSLDPGVASKLAGSLNATQLISDGCRVKGVLNYIQNTKNVILAYRIARFAMLYNTAADHQKAGLLSSQGTGLFMEYLKNKSPSGKSYTQAGGFRNMMGDSRARPSSINAAKYSTGRTDDGLLGDVRQFLNEEPVISTALSDGSCKVVNNTYVQIGGFIAGAGAAFFSGGTTSAASIAGQVALGLASNVAISIGEQIFIKSATGIVLNGFEGGEEAGDTLASGWGSMRGLNSGANGLRPITAEKAYALSKEADAESKNQLAEMGVFERYFSIYNDRSLLNNLAVSNPSSSMYQPMSYLSNSFGLLGQNSIFSGAFRLFGGKTYAADSLCKDPQIQKFKLQSDAFCNVEVADSESNMNLDETEKILQARGDIDPEGEPTSDAFKAYIKDCHSGRTGMLYRNSEGVDPEKIKSGEFNPSQPSDVCIVGDPSEVTSGSYLDDVYKDNKTYPGGRFARYSHWYAYRVDLENIEDDINDTYPNSGQGTSTNKTDSETLEEPGVKIDKSQLGRNSDKLKCASGTKDLGVVTTKYTGELKKESGPLKIRLCQITDIPGTGNNKDGNEISGGAVVDARVSAAWAALGKAAKSAGIPLDSGSSFRLADSCGGAGDGSACARPGKSFHQTGLAIDFGNGMYGTKGTSTTSCAGRAKLPNNKSWKWLHDNADQFGIEQYTFEAWHWDPSGLANRCGKDEG